MERLKKIGKIKAKNAKEIKHSKLGIGFEKLDRDAFDPGKAYDKVAALGVKWVRIQSGWAKTEKEKGVYDFSWLDKVVDNLISRGLKPWICLCYGNGLYDEKANEVYGAVGIPPIYNEEDRLGWSNYVSALAFYFKDRVEYFEVWNEPDCWYSWDFKYDIAKEYGNFVIATSKAIHKGNSNAKVIGGALGARDIHWIDDAFSTGMLDFVDYISYHGYQINPALDNLKPDYLRAIIDKYNPSIGLIQGEAGFQSSNKGAGELGGGSWTPLKQAKCLLRSLTFDMSKDILFSSYFSCMDMREGLHGRVNDKASYMDFGYFGILGADFDENGNASGNYTPKPSYYALSNLAAIFSEEFQHVKLPVIREVNDSKRAMGKDCNDCTIISLGFSKPNGSYALAYWNSTDVIHTTFESTVSFSCAMLPEKVRLIDPLNGDIYEIPEDILEIKENGHIKLKNLPILDYPLFITFGEFFDNNIESKTEKK